MIKWSITIVLALAIGAIFWGEWLILAVMEAAFLGMCLASPLANIINRRQANKQAAIQAATHETPVHPD